MPRPRQRLADVVTNRCVRNVTDIYLVLHSILFPYTAMIMTSHLPLVE